MKATDIIKSIMKKKEVKPSVLADRLKIKNNTLSERMTQKNMSVLKLSEMLRAMDYKILITPRHVRLPDDSYELTIEDDPKVEQIQSAATPKLKDVRPRIKLTAGSKTGEPPASLETDSAAMLPNELDE